jgi:hypothetical protein
MHVKVPQTPTKDVYVPNDLSPARTIARFENLRGTAAERGAVRFTCRGFARVFCG